MMISTRGRYALRVLIDLAEDLLNAYKDLDTGHLLFDGGRIELN